MKAIDLEIFSPVTPIAHPLLTKKQVSLFVKRDDLIHPIISGNKWRKLKYVLQKARVEDKNHLVTFGGAYSNHLLATAAAAALFGFKATGFVRGEEVDNTHLFLCSLYGMQLLFTDRESYRDKQNLFDQHYGNDTDAFFIDEGGASAEAARGCSELVDELTETYDHLFCACGTGTTAAGIINGIAQSNLPTQFHAIPVFKNGGFIADEIAKYLTTPAPYHLHLDYHFGGYAKTTPTLTSFIEEFISTTGMLIDPIYTGKMLYAIFDLIGKDEFAPGSKIMAVHTGGIWGLLGMKEKFSVISKQ
jgi:1-aminocyclopropane-1-carboxylate deaminase